MTDDQTDDRTFDQTFDGPSAARRSAEGATPSTPITASEAVGLSITIAVYLVIAFQAIAKRVPLGHDEAVYALRGRDLAHSWSAMSGDYWRDYRAPGIPMMLALPYRLFGASSIVPRLLVMLCGLGIVVLTWAITRQLASRGAAVAAAASLVLTTGFMTSSTQVLADVPGTMFTLVATYALLVDCLRGRMRWSLIVVPLAVLASVLSRFGAPLAYGPALAAVSMFGVVPWVRRRAWPELAKLGGLAVATVVITYVVLMTTVLSDKVSPYDANQALTGGKALTPATGWRDFRELIVPAPDQGYPYWSRLAAAAFVAGLVVAVLAAVRQHGERRAVIVGIGVGAVTLVGVVASVGLVTSSYLVIPAPFWAMAIGVGWAAAFRSARSLLSRLAPPAGHAAFAAGVTIVLVSLFTGTSRQVTAVHDRVAQFDTLRAVAVSLGQQTDGDCVVITSYVPQVGWYSGCAVGAYFVNDEVLAAADSPDRLQHVLATSLNNLPAHTVAGDPDLYLLNVRRGKRQPSDDLLERLGPITIGDPRIVSNGPADLDNITVHRLDPCVATATCVLP